LTISQHPNQQRQHIALIVPKEKLYPIQVNQQSLIIPLQTQNIIHVQVEIMKKAHKKSHKTMGLIKNKLTFRIAVQTSTILPDLKHEGPSRYHSVITGLFSFALGLCSFGFCSSIFLETPSKENP
jgi:hypothetical protein